MHFTLSLDHMHAQPALSTQSRPQSHCMPMYPCQCRQAAVASCHSRMATPTPDHPGAYLPSRPHSPNVPLSQDPLAPCWCRAHHWLTPCPCPRRRRILNPLTTTETHHLTAVRVGGHGHVLTPHCYTTGAGLAEARRDQTGRRQDAADAV